MTARSTRGGLAVLLAAAIAGCSDSPTSPTDTTDNTITSPTSVTFPGVVGPGGTVSRSFAASRPGAATITVSGISPATPLGVGLGIPRADGTGCLLSQSATAAAGADAQLTTALDTGAYCAQVFAPPAAPDQVTFTVTLVYP